MATSSPQDIAMTEGQTPPPIPSEEPKYGGFTRFEIELEVMTFFLRAPTHAILFTIHSSSNPWPLRNISTTWPL